MRVRLLACIRCGSAPRPPPGDRRKGSSPSRVIWVRSCPLPASRTMSPARASCQRQSDCLAAVGLDGKARPGLAQPQQCLLDDRHGIFAARIVRGEHHEVASLSGGAPHLWPLAAVAVSAASKDGDHPALAASARSRAPAASDSSEHRRCARSPPPPQRVGPRPRAQSVREYG